MDEHKIIKSKNGYYQFETPPDKQMLSDFYENKYHKHQNGEYSIKLDDEEIKYHEYINFLIVKKAFELNPTAKTGIDIGCGPGFMLAELKKIGLNVKGADFSDAGVKSMHPELISNFIKGDIYETIEKEFEKNKYDIITSTNVIEHVINPTKLLEILKKGMDETSVLAIKAPNDFSDLQNKLVKEHLVNNQWWVSYPSHLAYFNKEIMVKFLNESGLNLEFMLADFPIDLFLLNDDLNYVNDASKGKIAHKQRVKTDLFLSEFDADKVINLYKAYADLGIGREITYFCKLK